MPTVQHLILLCGPQAVGKSTLLKKLQTGQAAALAQQLELDWQTGWPVLELLELSQDCVRLYERLIVQSPIPVPADEPGPLLEQVIAGAQNLTIVNLCASRQAFLRRMTVRWLRASAALCCQPGLAKVARWRAVSRRLWLYHQPGSLQTAYQAWQAFLKPFVPCQFLLVDSTEPGVLAASVFTLEKVNEILKA